MNKTKVSIIIPVYNGEAYMREAIDSALAQTYDNIEIIVVNDGSTDSTDEIARSYGDKIVYYKKENGGVSTALNLALEKMTGDYFSWLSHDDRYYPQKVEKEVAFLEENGYLGKKVIVFSDYDLMDENSKVFGASVKDHAVLSVKPDYCILRGDINGLSLLIPKTAFEECGNFRTDLRCVQDYLLWEQMMAAGYKFLHIPEILVTTRLHSNQQGNTSPVMLKENNEFWTNLIKHTSKERMEEFEGNELNFFKVMHKFLLTTPFEEAIAYAKSECERAARDLLKESENIKVTVIIPFYNRVDKLFGAIDSVYAQTHKNIELLLINDASTDDLSALKEYIGDKETETKIIDIAVNAGPANARNIGIENATGGYIAFLDSDDTFVPEKIERQLFEMMSGNANFSHTNYILKNADTGEESVMDTTVINGNGIPTIINNMCIASPTVMFKTSFLRESGIRYRVDLRYGEDVCFYLDCFKKTEVLAIPEPLSVVNTGGGSAAYDRDKQLTGIKTIAGYVLNDKELSKYDYNVGLLFKRFIELYDAGEVWPKVFYIPAPPPKKRSLIRRTLSAIKHRGVIATFKAGMLKIKRRLVKEK
ncbi:MAG: glycosyltransferase [Clostridia bacterium]|nr:glycosyltransferase [Clostridia bacterium]